MLTKSPAKGVGLQSRSSFAWLLRHLRPSLWQWVLVASYAAGVGVGWRALLTRGEQASPLQATATMMVLTFAGWYVWGFFTHVVDKALFRGPSDYLATLDAFGRAYVFQALFLLAFTRPLGWLWGWIALYATVAAWGIIGPRHLGMRTRQALLAVTLGLFMWLACLSLLSLLLNGDGLVLGVGIFLT
jgi:hypothetical protein